MIDDDIRGVAAGERVLIHVKPIPEARADETNDDVGRVAGIDDVIRQTDAVTGRGLAGDGEIALGDAQRRIQIDRAGNREDDGARHGDISIGHALAQGSSTGVVQIGDDVNIPSPPSAGETAESLRTGKGRRLGMARMRGHQDQSGNHIPNNGVFREMPWNAFPRSPGIFLKMVFSPSQTAGDGRHE